MDTRTFTIPLIILLLTIASITLIKLRGEPVVVETKLEKLPVKLAGFTGVDDSFGEQVYKELNADKHIYRHYETNRGQKVSLYIGYYGTKKGGRSSHTPYACLPGAGWGIIDTKKIVLIDKIKDEQVDVNYIISKKGNLYYIIIFWYQMLKDKVVSNGIQQNILRFFGRLFYNRNDGAFVRISAFSEKDDIPKTNLLVKSFSKIILNELPNYWPIEK
jgi:EpsI family protein